MPQTAQEKAIHANSKSNGNSNEVTFASMVKDDEPDSNSTTDEKKKSWKSKFGFDYANEKRKNYNENKQQMQEANDEKLKEFREKFKEIRTNDELSAQQKNQKLDQLLGESGTFEKIKFTKEDEANIYKYKSYIERMAKQEGGGSTTTKTTVGGKVDKNYENKVNQAHRTMMANRENRAEEREEGEANKDESNNKSDKDVGLEIAKIRAGILPEIKSE
tara:strand:- start:1885 stop:2538 length:654 start_codon:yes stop_codon:yes gene_type:complete